jgi:uncharacterized phage protein (TIGR01671 family)
MREIKFRFWDLQKKIWRNPMDFDLQSNGEIGFFNHRIVIQQYTGLKDKNGKEIYEGDIVECDKKKDKIIGVVAFYEDLGSFKVSYSDIFSRFISNIEDVEVIGNIFENKELLE